MGDLLISPEIQMPYQPKPQALEPTPKPTTDTEKKPTDYTVYYLIGVIVVLIIVLVIFFVTSYSKKPDEATRQHVIQQPGRPIQPGQHQTGQQQQVSQNGGASAPPQQTSQPPQQNVATGESKRNENIDETMAVMNASRNMVRGADQNHSPAAQMQQKSQTNPNDESLAQSLDKSLEIV